MVRYFFAISLAFVVSSSAQALVRQRTTLSTVTTDTYFVTNKAKSGPRTFALKDSLASGKFSLVFNPFQPDYDYAIMQPGNSGSIAYASYLSGYYMVIDGGNIYKTNPTAITNAAGMMMPCTVTLTVSTQNLSSSPSTAKAYVKLPGAGNSCPWAWDSANVGFNEYTGGTVSVPFGSGKICVATIGFESTVRTLVGNYPTEANYTCSTSGSSVTITKEET